MGITRGIVRKYPELKPECTKDKYARDLLPSNPPQPALTLGLVFLISLFRSLDRGGLLEQLFGQCLFALPSAEEHGATAPPKCKTVESRTAAFSLLTELVPLLLFGLLILCYAML